MLPHYSPLKVAESFSVLSGPVPRADRPRASVARPGTDPMTTFALQRDRRAARCPTTSPQQLSELLGYLEDRLAAPTTRSRGSRHASRTARAPEPWLLGSSPQSAVWAAELGLPYSFADFINPDGAAIAPSTASAFARARQPDAAARGRVWAICAATDEEASASPSSSRMAMTHAASWRADRGAAPREGAALSRSDGRPRRPGPRDAR